MCNNVKRTWKNRRRRRTQLLDEREEKIGYCKLKEAAALNSSSWRALLGRGRGLLV